MPNTVRIKRRAAGGAAGAPSSLSNAELAFNEQDDTLYYGKGTGGAGGTATTVEAIAGKGSFVDRSTAQNVSGVKTFVDSPEVPTVVTSDNSTKAASTAFVKAQGYVTGNQNITVSGDASGSGTTAIALTLASVGTAGTYTKVTTDAKGRVTAGTTLAAGDIPTLTAAKISDFDTQVRTSRLDQMAAPTAAVSLNSQRITGLASPTADTDAATKGYVDAARSGLDVKDSVRAATTANITLSGAQTIDGVSVIAGDRVLVKDQSTASQNGIYVAAAGAWTRSTDADANAEVTDGMFTFVEEGTANGSAGFVLTTANPITIGTTALTFVQFSGAGQITAGSGMTKTGNTLDVVGTAGRIVANADSIDLATAGTAGTYRSVTTDAYGRVTSGTNPTTLAGYGITDAQGLDAELTAIAGLVSAADRLPYFTGSGTAALATFTAFGRSLADDVDAAAGRTTLGLGTIATQAASNVAITGGSITNLTTFDGITIDGGTF
jgi:phage-related tail fiber protein